MPCLGCDLAQPFEEAGHRRDDALKGLEDDAGQLVAMLPYHDGGRLQVVERGHQDFVADAVRDSSGIRDRLRKVTWPLRR